MLFPSHPTRTLYSKMRKKLYIIQQGEAIRSLFSEHRNLKNVNVFSPPGVSMVDGVMEQRASRNNLVCFAERS